MDNFLTDCNTRELKFGLGVNVCAMRNTQPRITHEATGKMELVTVEFVAVHVGISDDFLCFSH